MGVHGDKAKGMNEHALWADLKEVVEVKEAALVGATSIKPELRRHICICLFLHKHTFARNININFQINEIVTKLSVDPYDN